MFKSLKNMCNIPIIIKPFDKRDGANNRLYKPDINALCYAEGKILKVVNNSGIEVVSQKQLYMANDLVTVGINDTVIFEGKEYPVKALGPYYDKGAIDIQVVYL
jgi:hypothetical protein